MFVFRNNTVERFFPKDYTFSGYDDISLVPSDADGYVWFYQAPLAFDTFSASEQVRAYSDKLDYVMQCIDPGKTVVALTMEPLYSVPFTDDDHLLREAVEEYNHNLFLLSDTNPNLKVIDLSEFTSAYPGEELIDWKFYFLSQMGLNPRLSKPFQEWWRRKLDSIALRRKKCLVLDLDNTLWGGVLGEDGIDGIKLSGDYPGKAFHFFQEAILSLSKSGVILAVCSKNNEADVLEAWEKNPFMVLRKEHFSAMRINWNDKASNLKELASELNIGLDSFVFVDDNPTERELIRQMLPMVSVPDFPIQPYDLPQFFSKMVEDYFRVYTVTEEDRKKTEQYKANAARSQAQSSFSDFSSFLRSLDMHLKIERADQFNIPRIAQMTQKTNQFNLTTRRYTDADVRSFIEKGWKIWCLSVADRFGDSGITGTVFVDGNRIDTLLLSCRILGKGIEGAFLKSVLYSLRDEGVKEVHAEYIPTAKNSQVKDFYDKQGFTFVGGEPDGARTYSLSLAGADLTVEDCYHVSAE
ncbi:MAG: HAD-IIIC family phosphatase [Bacteroidales bacterium]|nr:HAD-IIIC family phosphatase [Bacteroidales bacterium]